MKPIRLGMIGVGVHASTILLPSLTYVPTIERVALCDIRRDVVEEKAKRFGFNRAYTNYHEMIETEDLDGVIACINAAKHPEVSVDLLRHGIDVLVEKPAAVTPEQAKEMYAVSKQTGHFIMVEHNKRHSTVMKRALDIVCQPEFGEVVMINASMLAYPYDTLFNCMMEWQIHNIDIIRAFAGDVAQIHACKKTVADQRAAIAILMQFENGIVGTTHWGTEGGINHGQGAGRGCERLEVVGSNARVLVIENDRRIVYYHGNVAQTWEPDWSPHTHNQSYVVDGYVGAIKHFTECIVSREKPNPDIYDEYKALEFIYEVAKQLEIPQEWKVVEGQP